MLCYTTEDAENPIKKNPDSFPHIVNMFKNKQKNEREEEEEDAMGLHTVHTTLISTSGEVQAQI